MTEEIAFAGRLLAPQAARAARLVASRVGLDRLRVDSAVSRSTRIAYPRRKYRSFLKGLKEDVFREPVEIAGPRLAAQLDAAFAEVDPTWEARSGHLSAALTIIEATYAQLLSILDDKVARTLSEAWARQRNDRVLLTLVSLAQSSGGLSVLGNGDLAHYLRMRSWERRAIRLEAFGVERERVHSVMSVQEIHPREIEPGSVGVVVGPYGSGKSEYAEEWHRGCIERLEKEPDAPIPLWLDARDISEGRVESAIVNEIGGREFLTRRGASIVVDGLDEVDATRTDSILTGLRLAMASSPLSAALVTSRPGVTESAPSNIEVPPLTDDSVRRLVELLTGDRLSYYSWPEALRESAARPFFALAAATSSARLAEFRSHADLVRDVVERALQRGGARSVVTSRELFDLLVGLAVELTDGERSERRHPLDQRERALQSRLVSVSQSGVLEFSLPIFEQWFASRAILRGDVTPERALSSALAFDRWRWAVALALTEADEASADRLFASALRLNPGAAAWVVRQVESARFAPSDDRSLDQVTSSRRLLEAARQWIDAIGPLAAHCLPIEGAGRPIGIGVRTNGGRLVRAWRLRAGDVDEVEVLPDDAHPFAYIDGWAGMWMGSPPAGPNWPWILLRDDIAAQSIAVLESELPLGGDSGVWHDELRYRQCRILAQEATIFHRPLGVHDLLARAEEALAAARPAVRTLFRFGRFDLADVQLQELAEWLRGLPQDCVERPVPAPDLDGRSGSGWVWDVYSDQRLLEYAAEVYGNACQAYDELARHTFGKFAWSLGLSAIAPVAIVGSVHPASEGVYPSPGIDYRQIPLDLMQAEVAGRSGVWISRNGRCALSLAERSEGYSPDRWDDHWRVVSTWIAAQRGATPFRRAVVGSSVLHTNQDRPASAIAAGWMFDDLKAFGLAQGTFPRLDH